MIGKFLKIFILCGFSLLIMRCTDKSKNPTGPDKLDIAISLSQTEAAPGTILTLATNKSLTPANNFSLFFDGGESPVLGTSDEKIYEIIVPNVAPGVVKVYLKNKSDNSISESLSFSILSLPATGLPLGKVVMEVVTSQKDSYITIRDSIIPKLQTIGILSPANSSLFQSELMRSITILQQLEQQIQSLTDNDKQRLDQLLYSAGMLDLVCQTKKSINKITSLNLTTSDYTAHHILVALDGFSAILTATEKVWTLAGLIASAGTAGGLAPLVVAGSIVIASIDYSIDGFLPTDLNELYVDTQENINVSINSSIQIRIIGKFVPQSNPINESIELFVSALLKLVDIGVTESFILNLLTSIGIQVNDSLCSLTEKWQSMIYIECQIDPSYYEGGFSTFLTIIGEQLKINISGGTLQDFLKAISGFDYHVQNPSIASFNENNSTVSGLKLGSSLFVYSGYRFKSLSGLTGILTFGIEWPILLPDEKIKQCNIIVQQTPIEGLVAYYPFNNNANDESGIGNHGTVSGAALTPDRKNNPNSAYYFDGTNDYIKVEDAASLRLSEAATIAMWLNIDVGTDYQNVYDFRHMLCKGATYGGYYEDYSIGLSNPQGALQWSYNMVKTDTPLPQGSWHHIAISFDYSQQKIKLYVDGNLEKTYSQQFPKLTVSNRSLYIGARYSASVKTYFKGKLDDILIYNRALSQEEIRLLSQN